MPTAVLDEKVEETETATSGGGSVPEQIKGTESEDKQEAATQALA